MDRKVLILSASVGSGHNSAAAALETVVRNRADVGDVRRVDILQTTPELYRTLYDDAYFKLVETVPWVVSWGYDLNDPPFKLGGSVSIWDRINTTSIARSIRDFAPDVVLCTHFLPARLVSLLQTRGSLHARLAVITTDYDFQGLWLSNTFTRMFLAREETREHLTALGVPADRLTVSGIPVQYALGRPVNRESVLEQFGLRADAPLIMVSAGAAGGAYAESVVRQLQQLPQAFQAIVICGHNDELKQRIESLVGPQNPRFKVLGFTTQMADLMRVSHLFVGKPGGLSASECMAAGLPMVLIDPIPGQEERNSDYLLEQGAAVRCHYDTTIGWKIGTLLDDPAWMRSMAEAAARTGQPNAAGEIAEIMVTGDDGPLWISYSAQRSLLAASERDASELSPRRTVTTLFDTETGVSQALITETQAETLMRATKTSDPDHITLTRANIGGLRRLRRDPFLMMTLHRLLGGRRQAAFSMQ